MSNKNIYIKEIKKIAAMINREVKLMEVCGTHTQVIARYGIKKALPPNIKLISGPGCPVCVTAKEDIDAVVKLALAGIPIFTYGDVIRVRGTAMSLADARSEGAIVREVYGVEELFIADYLSAKLATEGDVEKKPVFFGIGFETTAPMSASAVKRGTMLYSAHKAFIPAMRALLNYGEIKVDGLISPGHVGAIVGSEAFKNFRTAVGKQIPQVIAGFELNDVLEAILMILKQIVENRPGTENEYARVVLPEGNIKALKLIDEVFELENSIWRGLGEIQGSGFKLRKEFEGRDAKIMYNDIITRIDANVTPVMNTRQEANQREYMKGCLCADVIKGNMETIKCPNFRKICAPDNPQGPCMVSVEGACYIAYQSQIG